MKRILQFGLSSNKGGIEVVALKVFNNIDREKIKFDFLIVGDKIAFEDEINELGGDVYKITRRSKNPFKHYYEFYKFFKKNASKYDAIHCSYCTLYSILPIILSKFFHIPKIILHARSSNFNTKKIRLKIAHYANRFLANFLVTDFLAVSDQAAEFIFTRKRYKLKKYIVFRNPIDLEKFKFDLLIRNNIRKELKAESALIIGHVGVFLPVKNHDFILNVFQRVQSFEKNSILLLIGGGGKENIETVKVKAAQLGLTDKIIFAGIVDNVNEYMQAMDVFILPSLYEGMSNSLIEAQVAGLPCLVSNTIEKALPYVPTVLVNFLPLNTDYDVWANEIIVKAKTVFRKDRVEEFCELGFSKDKCIENYEKLYNS